MSLAKLSLDQAGMLTFEVSISGTRSDNAVFELRLISEKFDLTFDGDYDGSKFVVKIPELKGVIPAGIYPCSLEAIVEGDKFFKPIEDSIEFIEEVKVTSKLESATPVGESVHVKVGNVKTEAPNRGLSRIRTNLGRSMSSGETYSSIDIIKKVKERKLAFDRVVLDVTDGDCIECAFKFKSEDGKTEFYPLKISQDNALNTMSHVSMTARSFGINTDAEALRRLETGRYHLSAQGVKRTK